MTPPAKVTFVGAALLWTLVVVRIAASAQQNPPAPAPSDSATRSILTGVYTEAQAERGKARYADVCERCHGKSLEGDPLENTDPLAGDDFVKSRSGSNISSLYRSIFLKMPHDEPGTLKPQEASDILAYILKFNGFPAGKDELPADMEQLKLIRFESKGGR